MIKECPFLFYVCENNDDSMVSIPIHTVTTKKGVRISNYINAPVCYKDKLTEAGAHCMTPKYLNCKTYNKEEK